MKSLLAGAVSRDGAGHPSPRELAKLAGRTFSARLRERCNVLGVSANDIASAVGCSRQHARRMLVGERCPTLGRAAFLAALYEIRLDDLLGLEKKRRA